ncbi:MAG: Uxx-star family glutaredoxin-like (seleno)protein [Candidatus Spechtbacterales bacterium]|nr:Uxx-star family glutaredoxin-like (seleno)protein [Candidatus Spechtbacterales bacterium]
MKQVTIYTTPTCHYCHAAKEFFGENNVEYTEKDVAKDVEARNEMVEKSGQLGVPVIDVGGDVIVGFNKEALQDLLELKQ